MRRLTDGVCVSVGQNEEEASMKRILFVALSGALATVTMVVAMDDASAARRVGVSAAGGVRAVGINRGAVRAAGINRAGVHRSGLAYRAAYRNRVGWNGNYWNRPAWGLAAAGAA